LRFPGVTVPEVKNLKEVSLMIAEHAIDWTAQSREEGREEGREQGREEGREEGRQEGEATVLLRLLQRKFGSLRPEIQETVRHADADQLLDWADRFVTASTLDEIINGSGT
jgi:flagellar biosynthesis/type III secretory pathway protein FliH